MNVSTVIVAAPGPAIVTAPAGRMTSNRFGPRGPAEQDVEGSRVERAAGCDDASRHRAVRPWPRR